MIWRIQILSLGLVICSVSRVLQMQVEANVGRFASILGSLDLRNLGTGGMRILLVRKIGR